jgi:hypothetical protein
VRPHLSGKMSCAKELAAYRIPWQVGGVRCTLVRMVTLAEIESAAAGLSPAEKQELMLFLASRLRAEGAPLPEPRTFTSDEMAGWIAEDEADMRRLRSRP